MFESHPIVLVVEEELDGERVDRAVSALLPEYARNAVQRLCGEGRIFLNGRPSAKNDRISEGDRIEMFVPPVAETEVTAQDIPLDIVYEDDALLVVNKPRGMVVHPAPGNPDGTLVNALLWHCGGSLAGIGGVARPGIVHRIDKDTSGLLMVAKTERAHRGLSEQIKAHTVTRRYHAVVHGRLKQESGTVSAPIGRHPTDRKKMSVHTGRARDAVTHYRVLEELRGFTYIAATLETGRTHQIRVHMAHIGHPVAGDPVYGPKKGVNLGGQCLHAALLGFRHPVTGADMEFSAPLPDWFAEFIARLR